MASGASRLPRRKQPSHPTPVDRFNLPTILFVTVCVEGRQAILANDDVHSALQAVWAAANHWLVGSYVIMPDHLHLFCTPGLRDPVPVKRWTEYWKHECSKKAPSVNRQWQTDCWDTEMRNRDHYEEKLAYVRENPVRAGLVEHPEDWPYQGRLNVIRW